MPPEVEEKKGDPEGSPDNIRAFKKLVEEVLYNLQVVLSTLENPYFYLSKYVDPSVLKKTGGASGEAMKPAEKSDAKETPRLKKEPEAVKAEVKEEAEPKTSFTTRGDLKPIKAHLLKREPCKDIGASIVNRYGKKLASRALLLSDFLITAFGLDSSKEILYSFLKNNLISVDVYTLLIDSLNIVSKLHAYGNVKIDRSYIARTEDYILIYYLLNIIEGDDDAFYLTLFILKKLYSDLNFSLRRSEGVAYE